MSQHAATYFEANKDAWNKRAAVHKDTAFYDVDGFKAGKSALNAIELEELGNVQGKSLLHLQCHFGMDTLSWAREGATVTGIDFSEEAIKLAKELAAEVQVPAEFICCNVYDVPAHVNQQFDIVFTSYGVVGWLPDLDKWAEVIAACLKPGGTFYMVEFHPVLWMMDDNFTSLMYPYHNAQVIVETKTGTYADKDAPIHYEEYSWNHSLSEVITALLKHGLKITLFHEFPYSCYNCFEHLQQGADGYWRIHGKEVLPMMYSIKAIKE
ncbi:class I SAM-dependent methyltransferase [Aridibaculum aurantiacum]|uniref:class I SAM-dependent methyltransferase n=1 Tax=Aridibaculum aurantiacum TaxID=2810307 RepID=UPI001A976D5A|nr:class I SAM-dependent methyltransferase [Aridibaculum aurantiacum]